VMAKTNCMSKKPDYTAAALDFTARFPILTYVSIQINFWVIANILLAVIMYLQARAITETLNLPQMSRLGPAIIIAVLLGILYGIILGLADYFFDKNIFKRQSLGKIILLKTAISFIVLAALTAFIRFVLLDFIFASSSIQENFRLNSKTWAYFFNILLIYYFFMTLVINFINQVRKKYGPGVLVPILMGKYRTPQETERIFMFMDLKASTSLAEILGHLKYSSFIRDSFMDINQVLLPHRAEVYQYVGDEIVVSWNVEEGLKNLSCIKFFFACIEQFASRTQYYTDKYGFLPYFKAGLHMGAVTAVEIGEIKRDIAYHGDTLNTAARIQSVCNEHNKTFLISEYLLEKIGATHYLRTEDLGMIQLRGKTKKIGISSIERLETALPTV
jgi:adenylate cyclase